MVTVRYWAAARAAAGIAEEQYGSVDTLSALLAASIAAHGEGLRRVMDVCSFLVDGTPVGRRDPHQVLLAPAAVVEVLPPFAGG